MAIAERHQSATPETARGDVPVISAHDVSKTFGDGRVVALNGATFDVRPGEFIALVGPSGCGKSTLLRIVAGLLERSGGDLRVHGEPVKGPHTDVAMMFQKPTLLAWRTAIENVLLPAEIAGKVTEADRQKAEGLLELTGLTDFAFSFPRQLSGGMQQRVALARLLQTGADVLLLDEPFGALDEFTRERLNVELSRITSEVGATTMFVTHNIGEAIFLADRVFVMTPRPGEIAAIVDVPLPRPRDPAIQVTPEFNALVAEVRGTLGGRL
ncbi:ABC transporter ATP-binding protein [Acuticoccus sp. M5D2P5]|uniref:ABC transporter ATP-binding protein n=1 Tax=Acuticoccus kalidii TaxID=2910977 RepID=UPI001F160D97|nr:ABC transporter ATP-binding protein [Acuticoccus kalidii]MCF3934911.1 ABC transporter ATP-binding protein [Acuticoccus kalidii]